MSPLIVIPARMNSTRLPGKPLADIGGLPMIVQVMRRALESGLGEVLIACDGEEIASAVRAHNGLAILTDPALPSGSDRVWEAVQRYDPYATHDIIINLQGDLPTLEPYLLKNLLQPLMDIRNDATASSRSGGAELTAGQEGAEPPVRASEPKNNPNDATASSRNGGAESRSERGPSPLSAHSAERTLSETPPVHAQREPHTLSYDLTTLAAPITRDEEKSSQSVVKPILGPITNNTAEALDFLRGPAPSEPMYHHIGVYAYRRAALERFVSLPPSARESERKLEQMRALDAGMRIACVLVDTVPLGVDTPEDLEKAREILCRQ